MGIVIDLVLIIILAINIFLGYKKGLVNVIFNLCAFLVAMLITIILYRPIAGIVINNTKLYDNIRQTVLDKGILEKKDDVSQDSSDINKYIQVHTYNALTDVQSNSIEAVADSIAINTVNIIVSISLFVVVRILLVFAKTFAGALAELPIIKQFNKLGGVLYGAIVGLVLIYIILTIMFFVVSINGSYDITNAIDSSIITKYLYQNNIILNIFHWWIVNVEICYLKHSNIKNLLYFLGTFYEV